MLMLSYELAMRPASVSASLLLLCASPLALVHAQSTAVLDIRWDAVSQVSKTTATLQVVVNPLLRRGSAIHDSAFRALHDLGAEYVRYVPWLPYPKLAVAELEPGVWDTSLIDPMTIDFFHSTEGHATILNFSTIPAWLFKTDKPVTYPADRLLRAPRELVYPGRLHGPAGKAAHLQLPLQDSVLGGLQ